jgi:hypothetical protein
LCLMSFIVSGFFALVNGRQESLSSSANKVTNYVTYDSSFTCSNDTSAPVVIRHFSAQHAILTDNTIAFIIAKAGFPAVVTESIVLHAQYFFPVPGHPSSAEYEDGTPDMLHPVATIVGHVVTPLSPPSSIPRRFTIATSSYVTSGNVLSTIELVIFISLSSCMFMLRFTVACLRTLDDGQTHHLSA